jgi:SpoVK/Ycf46/Vps4 family AAA+-type ATPase
MLTVEEQQHKDEIITLTEQVLDAKGIECDSKISKISEEQLREILEGVRRLRKRKKKIIIEEKEDGVEDSRQKEEEPDIVAIQ